MVLAANSDSDCSNYSLKVINAITEVLSSLLSSFFFFSLFSSKIQLKKKTHFLSFLSSFEIVDCWSWKRNKKEGLYPSVFLSRKDSNENLILAWTGLSWKIKKRKKAWRIGRCWKNHQIQTAKSKDLLELCARWCNQFWIEEMGNNRKIGLPFPFFFFPPFLFFSFSSWFY